MTFRGDLVRLARQARRLTQAELASMTQVTQAYISMIEDGIRLPSEEQGQELAGKLKFPLAFFEQDDLILGTGIGEVFHRRRKSMRSRDLESIHAWKNISTFALKRLLAPIDCPAADLPPWDRDLDDNSVELAATLLRARWHVPDGPVSNVSAFISRAGLWTIPLTVHSPQIDAIGQWTSELPPLIFINPTVPQDRLRFTTMHEIGHLMLHQGRMVFDLDERVEAQANLFAAAFLMPAASIKNDLRNLTINRLAALKQHWKVAMSALLMRASQLEVIQPAEERSLWKELSVRGWKAREPADLDVQGERPFHRFEELQGMYRLQRHYTDERLAATINLEIEDAKKVLASSSTSKLRLIR